MASFFKLDENNKVIQGITIANDILTSNGPLGENDKHLDGEIYCKNLLGGNWKQGSYNNKFRKQFPSIGFTYDSTNDVFIGPQPYISWYLNSNFDWTAPVLFPNIIQIDNVNLNINWDESFQTWVAYKILENSINSIKYTWNSTTLSWSN
jgi:hypothetical protein